MRGRWGTIEQFTCFVRSEFEIRWPTVTVFVCQVDAFSDRPFGGNPAAVCILHEPADSRWMQDVAAEMNLSETAFVLPLQERFGLRWFTPETEVDLCGHATLAAAHVLWETGRRRSWPIEFETRSGRLGAAASGEWIRLDFPADPPIAVENETDWASVLGAEPEFVGAGRLYTLVAIDGEEKLRNLRPDFAKLRELEPAGVSVTSISSSSRFDFVSRFFAPGLGVDEDPVTGSAHCMLGPYWGDRLGKEDLVAFQASSRGGIVKVFNRGDRTLLEGRAVTTLRGELLAAPE
jgi:PhzF family phenazine biosynthesis protein